MDRPGSRTPTEAGLRRSPRWHSTTLRRAIAATSSDVAGDAGVGSSGLRDTIAVEAGSSWVADYLDHLRPASPWRPITPPRGLDFDIDVLYVNDDGRILADILVDDIALALGRAVVRDRLLRTLAAGARWHGRFVAVRLVAPSCREVVEIRDPLGLLLAAAARSRGDDV